MEKLQTTTAQIPQMSPKASQTTIDNDSTDSTPQEILHKTLNSLSNEERLPPLIISDIPKTSSPETNGNPKTDGKSTKKRTISTLTASTKKVKTSDSPNNSQTLKENITPSQSTRQAATNIPTPEPKPKARSPRAMSLNAAAQKQVQVSPVIPQEQLEPTNNVIQVPSAQDQPQAQPQAQPRSPTNPQAKKQIEEDEEGDFELKVLTTKIPLTDIISGQKIEYCCKTIRCEHVACFDFNSFLTIHPYYQGFYERYDLNKISRYYSKSINNQEKTFQILKRGGKFSVTNRKFTRKTRKQEKLLKCPICSLRFQPVELIFDDFMDVVIQTVPDDIKMVDIDDDWIVTPVKEQSPYKEQEVITLDDEIEETIHSGSDDDDVVVTKRKRVQVIRSDSEDDKPLKPLFSHYVQNDEDNDDEEFYNIYGCPYVHGPDHDQKSGTRDHPVVID